ncbi:MAG: type II toxin-antitoxin system RelE/ParE family toxin [Coriobacteriia bacterium]
MCKYGPTVGRKLDLRLAQLLAAPSLDTMRRLPGRCHELQGDREGQLAIDLHGCLRLVFVPAADSPPVKPDGGLDWRTVTAIRILEVTDYHD